MIKNKFYITTPIYYVNASPHIGHSYTTIAADTLTRYKRRELGKDKVWFLTGSDEHGQKIQRAAEAAKLSPQEFVDKVVVQFKGLWQALNISYDDFIRTTETRHTQTVQKALEILYKKGDIYEGKYEGWYCTPDETFWPPSQITEAVCPDCKRPLEKISETNYFFKLSKYQDWLIKYIEENPFFIKPAIRHNEVLSFLKLNQLTDLCISRPRERLNWGIPLSFSPDHVAYVWFDALINYISAVGEFDSKDKYSSPWWEPEVEVVHLIGKDILRQHAIYWPIMLKALDIRLPDTVFAHGWWMIDQDKMSKSRGNVVNPIDMVNKFGIDVYRYFILRDVPFGMDGNFSEQAIIKRFNGDLANDLGNLVYRTLTMVDKYFQGNIPGLDRLDEQGKKIADKISILPEEIGRLLTAGADFNFSIALEKTWELINLANKYVEETKPWNLAKENKQDELKAFIRLLVEVIREAAKDIAPFMPQTAESVKAQLGTDKIQKGKPLFPRIEKT
jgi:methionyl-tRNA synthetase